MRSRPRPRHGRHLPFERLEDRALLTATAGFSSGLLTVTGDSGANLISIFTQLDNGTAYVMVEDDGVTILDGRPTGANVTSPAVQSIAVDGGDGDDVLYLQSVTAATGFSAVTSVSLWGGTGNDTIVGSALANSIFGGDGADVLVGGAADDTVAGGTGDDVYVFAAGASGSDTLVELADEGRDWLSFSDAEAPLVLSLSTADPQYWGAGTLTLADPLQFENVLGTAFDDFICGNVATNYLLGGDGNDTILGDDGNDFLVGDLGFDMLIGAGGDDLLFGGSGLDTLSGDLGDDVLVAADLELSGVTIESLSDLAGIADQLLAVWATSAPIADRIANLMGTPGAANPLPGPLQFHPGETLLNDEDSDAVIPLAGRDAVFVNLPTDRPAKSADATYIEIDPAVPSLAASFSAGALTVTYLGAGDLAYSVVGGNLLVNGQNPLAAPLPASDVYQVATQLGRLAGDLDDAALFLGNVPNLQAEVVTRAFEVAPPAMTAETIDWQLIAAAGEDWQASSADTAAEIAAAWNAGDYAPYWEVVCAGKIAAQQALLLSNNSEFSSVFGQADVLGRVVLGSLVPSGESSAMASTAGGEGGTISIQGAGNVDEGSVAVFNVKFDGTYFNGASVDWHTVNGSATGGTASCNGDFQAVASGRIVWPNAIGGEGDAQIKVPVFADYRVEGDETFGVQLSNLQNFDGAEGDMSLGASYASATIKDKSAVPQAFVGVSEAVVEGDLLRIPVTLSQVSQDAVTVNWSARDISTEGNQDFSPLSGSVTFQPLTCEFGGETLKYIEIQTTDDSTDEYDEELQILLTGGTNVQLPQGEETPYHMIVDNDPPPILSVVDVTVAEGAAATFTLSISDDSEKPISIRYYTVNGSALAPTDYNAIASTTITLDPGTTSRTVSVQTINDTIPEPTQYFWLFVTDGVNVRFPNDDFRVIAKGNITDNDPLHAQVVSVAYGPGNIPIEHDPLPVAGQVDGATLAGMVYEGRHYLDQNHNGSTQDTGDQQFPIAYVRGDTPILTAVIWAEYNEFVQPFRIKGAGDWNITLDPTLATKTGSTEGNGSVLLEATLISMEDLPITVNYKEALTVNFDVKADDDPSGWHSAGSSVNQAYLIYSSPNVAHVYHTVIHVGSTNAIGKFLRDDVVDGAWKGFSTNDAPANTQTVYGVALTYWKTAAQDCQTTAQLLAYHDGRCGAWADFFKSVLDVQGIDSARVSVVPDVLALSALQIGTQQDPIDGFLIKKWDPKPSAPASGPFQIVSHWSVAKGVWSYFTDDYDDFQFYEPLTTLKDVAGIPGQNEANPNSIFSNHALVAYGRVDPLGEITFYDPSYGVIRADEAEFDNQAVFGFYQNFFVPIDETQVGDQNADGVLDPALQVPARRVYLNPDGDQITFQ
ncbi:MAG: hypothetical protein K2Y37_02505 [Pirellulales bacterium]|nr:hypothetical protein [Pirellulales bacterium]